MIFVRNLTRHIQAECLGPGPGPGVAGPRNGDKYYYHCYCYYYCYYCYHYYYYYYYYSSSSYYYLYYSITVAMKGDHRRRPGRAQPPGAGRGTGYLYGGFYFVRRVMKLYSEFYFLQNGTILGVTFGTGRGGTTSYTPSCTV